jgi:hypothetical protein
MLIKNELEEIKRKILPILKKHKVRKAGIFGSYATGNQKKKSDVDILVELDKDVSLLGVINLKIVLENAVGKKIDLVEYSLIRKELKKRITNEEIPILK